jgi:transaldolase
MDEAARARDMGAVGATTNPTYVARLLQKTTTVPAMVARMARESTLRADEIYSRAYREQIKSLLALFLPLHERTSGRLGLVAIQGDPRRNDDASFILEEALDFRALGPNLIIKVPSTAAGAKALVELASRNIPTIATLGFSVDQAVYMAETYQRARERAACRPTCYITFIAGILDEFLAKETAHGNGVVSPEALRSAGCEATRRAYRIVRKRGFEALLMGGGARGTHHFTELVGGEMAITVGFDIAEQLERTAPPVTSRIDASMTDVLLKELEEHLPTFRAASREGSLAPETFPEFGPVVDFQNSFLAGVSKVTAYVDNQRALPKEHEA